MHFSVYGQTADELAQMEHIVSACLDMAELQAMRHIPMTMGDWEIRLNGYLRLMDRPAHMQKKMLYRI